MITFKFLSLAAIAMAAAFVPSAHAEILIAVAGPMTGQHVWTGKDQHQGKKQVHDELARLFLCALLPAPEGP